MKYKFAATMCIVLLGLILLSACQTPAPTTTTEPGTEPPTSDTVVPSPTSLPPTPTLEALPAAAVVNGEAVLESDFEAELQRFLDAQDDESAVDLQTAEAVVLEDMIDTQLLAQGARENGFVLTDETYNERYASLVADIGGEDVLADWLSENHYDPASFERLYRLAIEAGWMRDKILADVPERAEQIRGRQILVQSKTLADEIYALLLAGREFATFAWQYDPISGGELGWFPRDYLVIPEIEDAVFALQPGEFTEVIKTDYGYQIIEVMERELDRMLSQDALLTFQASALNDWVENRKSQSEIRIEIE